MRLVSSLTGFPCGVYHYGIVVRVFFQTVYRPGLAGMKKAAQLTILLLAVAVLTGCRSTSFLDARFRDLGDAVTIATEVGGVNASLQAGPMMTGLGYSKGQGKGFINGRWCKRYDYKESHALIVGAKEVYYPYHEERSDRIVWCESAATFMWAHFGVAEALVAGSGDPLASDQRPQFGHVGEGDWREYWQIEADVNLYFGLRVGLNIAELTDFFLGWVGVDMCNDDPLERRNRPALLKQKPEEVPLQERQKTWPPKL